MRKQKTRLWKEKWIDEMVTKDDFQLCGSKTEEEVIGLPDTKYLGNIKHDGTRVIAVIKNGQVALLNRRGYNPYKEFAEVVEDLKQMPDAILDAEVIDFSDTFNILQRRSGTRIPAKQDILRKQIPVKMMVFDILQLDGQTLTGLMLKDRITIMEKLFKDFNDKFVPSPAFHQDYKKPFIEMSEYKPIKEMLAQAHLDDSEGIIVKDITAPYLNGKRTDNWSKVKFWLEGSIKACKYEINPKGITVEDDLGNRCLVAGSQSNQVKQLIDTNGEVEILTQYLERTADGRYRFISYRGLVGNQLQ